MLLGDKTASSIFAYPECFAAILEHIGQWDQEVYTWCCFLGQGKKKAFLHPKKALKRAEPSLNSHLCSIANETDSAMKRNGRLPVALCWIESNNATIILTFLSTRVYFFRVSTEKYILFSYVFFYLKKRGILREQHWIVFSNLFQAVKTRLYK